MQCSALDLGADMVRHNLVSCSTAQMETNTWSHSTCSTSSLLQVRLTRPQHPVVCQIPLDEKFFDFRLTKVDNVDTVVDSDACFGNVGS